MRSSLALLLLVSLSALVCAQDGQPSQSASLALTHVTVVDVAAKDARGALRPDQTVIVTGDRIVAVGRTGRVKVPAGAQVVDAAGKFLVPGLWDMHAHPLSHIKSSYEWIFPMLVAHGVTGVRVLGNNLPFEQISMIRREVSVGGRTGPRLGALTGRILDGPGTAIPHASVVAATPAEGRQLVRTYKRQGMDFIKVYDLLSREVYLAIADEARRQKLPVAGHVPAAMSAAEVSDLGQVSIEHVYAEIFITCSRDEAELRKELGERLKTRQGGAVAAVLAKAVATYDERKAQRFFARLRRNGTWVCPTVVVFRPVELIGDESKLLSDYRMRYIPAASRERWHNAFQQRSSVIATLAERQARYALRLKIVGAMHRAGVLLAGSDTPNPYIFPGFSLHEELELLTEAGLTPLEALRTATVNPAKFLGREKDLGAVERGKLADLVLLDADPLADIRNTQKINAVMVSGRLLDRKALDALLAEAEAAAKQ